MANITIGSNAFGGPNCLSHLRLIELAMGGLPIPEKCYLNINDHFNAEGHPDSGKLSEKIDTYLNQFMWYVEKLSV